VQLDVGYEMELDMVVGIASLTRIELYLWDFELEVWDYRGYFYVWDAYTSAGSRGTTLDPGRFLGEDGEVRVRVGRTWSPSSSVYELKVDQLRVTTHAEKP